MHIDKMVVVGFEQHYGLHRQHRSRHRCVWHWLLHLDRIVRMMRASIVMSRPLILLSPFIFFKKKKEKSRAKVHLVYTMGAYLHMTWPDLPLEKRSEKKMEQNCWLVRRVADDSSGTRRLLSKLQRERNSIVTNLQPIETLEVFFFLFFFFSFRPPRGPPV